MSANENADYRTCLAFASRFAAEPYSNFGLCYAPFPRFQTSCNSGSGGSQRRTQAGHNTFCSALPVLLAVQSLRDQPMQSLRDPTLVSLRNPLPTSNMLSSPEQYGNGSWQSAFPDQLSKGTLRRKNYRQIPQGMLRYAAPPSCKADFPVNHAAAARKDEPRPVIASSAMRSLRDPALQSLRDPLPLTRLSTISKSMAKGRGSLHFQTSYPREHFEEKNYRQIPQGMLRYAAPPSCGSKHRATPAAGALDDKTFAVSMHSAWSQLSRKKLKSKKSPTYCKKLTKSLTTAM